MEKFKLQLKRHKNYFEGWYLRFTSDVNYAVIFAITNCENDPHAFIQVFSELDKECVYKRFNLSDFQYKNQEVFIKDNKLSLDSLYLNIDGFNVDLSFTQINAIRPSAMGYLSKFPLDTFQEVVIMSGMFKGTINNHKTLGTIYMEKTYGNKFPVKWIWLQSNDSEKKSNISFSVGYIPMFKRLTKGWLILLETEYKNFSFHSFQGVRMKHYDNKIIIKTLFHKIIITFNQNNTILLVGPGKNAKMCIDVFESLTSSADIKIYRLGKEVFSDTFKNVGLEHMNM